MDFDVPPEVAERLGYHVYLYVDPRSGRPFYVGKGVGSRMLAHLGEKEESRKANIIGELETGGLSPRIEILARSLPDEMTAFRIEAAVIDLLGLDNLANLVRGSESMELGRVPLEELIFQYAAKPVEIEDPVLLIRVNQYFRPGMSREKLYDVTRGVWKLGSRRERVEYVFAVFEKVVREVYEVKEWRPAKDLTFETRHEDLRVEDRWGFEGDRAPEAIQKKYVGRSVADYLPKGAQNPLRYVNC